MENPSRKILFLDFDGVLHPDSVYLEHRRPVLHAEGTLFMWAPYLVRALARYPEVRLVLSTSWVRARGFSRARDVLPEALRKKVVGATWHSLMERSEIGTIPLGITWWDNATRYQQIARYVARAKVENWVAIDDDNEGWADRHADRLIWTDPDRGVSDPQVLAQLCEKLAALH